MENSVEVNFKEYLNKRWYQVYTSQDANFILRGDIQNTKFKQIGSYYAVFNESLKKKRIVHIDNKTNSVYLNFDSKTFNFNKVTEKEVLFYINFDNEELITKQQALKITSDFLDNQIDQNNEQTQNHPIIINVSPICRNHALIAMFPDQQLPQIVGTDVILSILNLFKLSPEIIIGYNSVGANSSINHLHFHILYPEDLIKNKILPIQRMKRKSIHKTSLINPKEKVNMYNVGVVLEQLIGPIKAIILSPLDPKADQSQIFTSLSYVFGLVINQLLEMNIAHNIILCDSGYSIYIFPRQFKAGKTLGWVQLSGVLLSTSQEQFKKLNEQKYISVIKDIAISDHTIESIKKKLLKILQIYI